MSRWWRSPGMARRMGALAGLLAFAIAMVLAGGGCGRAQVRSRPHAAAAAESTATDDADDIYSATTLPIPDLGYEAREGRTLYRHYCMTCHGEEGLGDGFNAYNLETRPQSLADSAFQAQHSDSDLVTAIRSGGAAVGLSRQMPPWGRTLSERQILHIVDYVRTLRTTGPSEP